MILISLLAGIFCAGFVWWAWDFLDKIHDTLTQRSARKRIQAEAAAILEEEEPEKGTGRKKRV